jgi:hypothetical protein
MPTNVGELHHIPRPINVDATATSAASSFTNTVRKNTKPRCQHHHWPTLRAMPATAQSL